jgi:MFS family permease
MRSYDEIERKTDFIINISTLLFFLTMQCVAPYLSQVAVDLGATEFMVALLTSMYAVSSIGLRPLSGFLNDRGYSMYLMIIGSSFMFVSQIIYLLSRDIYLLYIGRFLQGVGIAFFIPTSLYMAATFGREETISKRIATRSLMISIAATLGPMIGGLLVSLGGGWTLLFAGSLFLSLTTLIMILLNARFINFFRENMLPSDLLSLTVSEYKEASERNSLKNIMKPEFISLLVSNFLFSSAYSLLTSFLPAYHRKNSVDPHVIGVFFTISSFANMSTRAFYLKIISSQILVRYAFLGVLLLGSSLMIISIDPLNTTILYITAVLNGAGMGLTIPSLQTMALSSLDKRSRGLGSSVYTMMFDAANLIAPPLIISIVSTYYSAIKVSSYIMFLTLIPIAFVSRSYLRKMF